MSSFSLEAYHMDNFTFRLTHPQGNQNYTGTTYYRERLGRQKKNKSTYCQLTRSELQFIIHEHVYGHT